MTQKDKELLLKDLCARLPYGVKAKYYGLVEECECCDTIDGIYPMNDEVVIGQYGVSVDMIKPYLFPFSSMGPKHYVELVDLGDETSNDCFVSFNFNQLDWLNAHHYDYRRLIEKGLAMDATGLGIY